MARTYYKSFERDNGQEVTVEYSITPYDPGVSYGPAESCYPPEGGEVEIVKVFSDDAPDLAWTDKEDDDWCARIAETHDHSDYADDPDYWRDE
ncbi:hypothetical protein B9J07_12870 [Sinorhizobium sp. LM21]|uniref:hypothetical protein n=1 Tax=Sinorhizobium phage phiLM21 TaxID=1524882 RepID=UPI0004E5BDAF|nr:hypothetical protein AWJ26_gp13 [Sinorhizobium phage phiLM21]AII27765.1 hypothetical protein phiLM21_p013 [Sinorhizobium phage phiLM21]OWZ93529.1 hypothetical protein B9J07_12870 [Sinorhizobium sp. LM21]